MEKEQNVLNKQLRLLPQWLQSNSIIILSFLKNTDFFKAFSKLSAADLLHVGKGGVKYIFTSILISFPIHNAVKHIIPM